MKMAFFSNTFRCMAVFSLKYITSRSERGLTNAKRVISARMESDTMKYATAIGLLRLREESLPKLL